jgi:uncharacterized protein (DUF2141 family)
LRTKPQTEIRRRAALSLIPDTSNPAQDVTANMTSRTARKALAALSLATIASLAFASSAPAASEPSPPPGCTGRNPSGVWLNIVAENMRSSKGQLAMTVYADVRKDFLAKGGSIWVGWVPAHEGETRGCVFLPKTGVYAIALYHDENANMKFDRSLLPEEGYGFSNNPSTLAGLPAWKSVRINVSKTNLTTHIKMKYP